MKLGPCKMVLKYRAVNTLPHHLMVQSGLRARCPVLNHTVVPGQRCPENIQPC